MKLASDAHYQANKAKIKARSRMRNEREMAKARVWICQFLETHHCVDCGESDYRVLEFDHRDAAEKLGGVSALMRQGRSLRVLMDEVAKCDVRCANCHRRRTIVQLGWWRV